MFVIKTCYNNYGIIILHCVWLSECTQYQSCHLWDWGLTIVHAWWSATPTAYHSLVETAPESVNLLLVASITSHNELLLITQHDSIPSCVLVMC